MSVEICTRVSCESNHLGLGVDIESIVYITVHHYTAFLVVKARGKMFVRASSWKLLLQNSGRSPSLVTRPPPLVDTSMSTVGVMFLTKLRLQLRLILETLLSTNMSRMWSAELFLLFVANVKWFENCQVGSLVIVDVADTELLAAVINHAWLISSCMVLSLSVLKFRNCLVASWVLLIAQSLFAIYVYWDSHVACGSHHSNSTCYKSAQTSISGMFPIQIYLPCPFCFLS